MKKILSSSLISLLILSCSISVPNNSTNEKDFTLLAKEYKANTFSSKALSDAYVSRVFNKFLSNENKNPVQILRQLEFARYLKNTGDTSYYNSLKTNINNDNSLYGKITGIAEVSQKMTSEPATFGTFVETLAPIAGVTPVANPASNILDVSFTANWNRVSYATGYILFVSDGTTTTYNISGTDTLSKNLTGLTSGTNYSYYIKAVNTDGQSQSSNVISLSTLSVSKLTATANVGSLVTDGNMSTYWNSNGYCCTPTQTVILDLGTIKTVNNVRLFPGQSPCGTVYYNVYTSTNGTNYTYQGNYSSPCNGWGIHNITTTTARYVKFIPTSWNGSWVAVVEIEIYGY